MTELIMLRLGKSLLIDVHTMVHVLTYIQLIEHDGLVCFNMALSSFKTLLSEIHVVQRIENANDNRTNKLTTKHNVMSTESQSQRADLLARSFVRPFVLIQS